MITAQVASPIGTSSGVEDADCSTPDISEDEFELLPWVGDPNFATNAIAEILQRRPHFYPPPTRNGFESEINAPLAIPVKFFFQVGEDEDLSNVPSPRVI